MTIMRIRIALLSALFFSLFIQWCYPAQLDEGSGPVFSITAQSR